MIEKEFITKTFVGKFEFPFGTPIMLHEMPDNKVGFEILSDESFIELLARTPECDDFRMLHSDHTWVAYSTKLDDTGSPIRAIGANPLIALKELRKRLGYED